MLRGSSAAREFRPVFRVAHFPAERRDPFAQFVAAFPILFAPCVLALFCQLCHFMRNDDVSSSFEIQNGEFVSIFYDGRTKPESKGPGGRPPQILGHRDDEDLAHLLGVDSMRDREE